ncbi:MAG: glycosyltransferase [Ignavibacteria bacterium CHB3]|nr:glycosyltransferase [Ignavibacteria bacterium CHB3]
MKANIIQFSFGDGFAGSAKMAVLSSKALIDSGHSVKLVVSKDSLTKKRALEKGIPVIEFDSKQKNSTLVKNILSNCKLQNTDFIVAYHSQDRKVVMKLKSKLKKEIISVAYRQNISLSTPIIGSFLYNKYFDYMIACSNGVAQSLIQEGIKKNKVFTIHNTTEIPENIDSISGEKIRNQFQLNDKIVLGISSWFHKERKGFDILFEVFSKLDAKFVLLIIGIPDENQNEVIEYAGTFGISETRIIMPGYVDNIYEYYKCGLPIIASDIPGNDEFVEDRKNGLLFNISKPEELIDGILELTRDPLLVKNFGINAKATFEAEFAFKRFAEKLNSFFDEAISNRKK